MINKVKENKRTLSVVKNSEISDSVYDAEVTRRIFERYPIAKQLALFTSGTQEQIEEFREFVASVKQSVNDEINGDV